MEAALLMDALPGSRQGVCIWVYQKIGSLAWDPDFTKVTAEEAKRIEDAENSGYVDADEIDWESIGTDE